MTTLVERDLILAPLASADRCLRAFFESHPAQGAGSRIVLRAGAIEQPAIAVVEAVRRPGDRTPRYSIHWEAASGGPYPEFDGELIVEADAAFNGFWLILTGAYVPPGGIAGQAFDVTLGRSIARATARDLLREMRVEIEANARALSAKPVSIGTSTTLT
jgi:hypothetical protein